MRRAREFRTDGTSRERTKPPPQVYHRHGHKRSILPSRRPQRSRITLLFPIILFGTILGLAFVFPHPDRVHSSSSSSAMGHMLKSSKLLRVPQQPQPKQDQEEEHSNDNGEEDEDEGEQQEILGNHEAINSEEDEQEDDVPMTRVILPHSSIDVPLRDATSWQSTDSPELTLFLQPNNTSKLLQRVFPRRTSTDSASSCPQMPSLFLPIDDFPSEDPFLPWIHDYFYAPEVRESSQSQSLPFIGRIQFVAQNRRRCQTGKGKEAIMKHWEPQMALFQAIPMDIQKHGGHVQLQLATFVRNATIPETRFVCHFHNTNTANNQQQPSFVTFSQFNFNYEYVLWRKRSHSFNSMFVQEGKDTEQFELSQLLFSCPVPREIAVQNAHGDVNDAQEHWKVDLIPLRTRARRDGEMMLTEDHVGPKEFRTLAASKKENIQSTPLQGGPRIPLQDLLTKSGRWANLPLCLDESDRLMSLSSPKTLSNQQLTTLSNENSSSSVTSNFMVACTWTAANYYRRGDATAITDAAQRIREWIAFHKLVGFDKLYIYDNTLISHNVSDKETTISPIQKVIQQEFANDEKVTYIPWPCRVCSNNRPNHPNPGERSSQYAAEASCRERFGESAEFMSFIDIDEFLVPMMPKNDGGTSKVTDLKPVLEKKKEEGHQVLKMRSSRARPRVDLMELVPDDEQEVCVPQGYSKYPIEACLRPRPNETLLRVYNCEYIRSPKPERFQRAMKQIYRPDFVMSHFVHYSTVTKPMTEYFSQKSPKEQANYERELSSSDWGDVFLDELNEAVLVHAKAIVPHETVYRSSICKLHSKQSCPLGSVCPDSTKFVDALHQKNVFEDEAGNFCNCWINHHLEDTLIPQMEALLR